MYARVVRTRICVAQPGYINMTIASFRESIVNTGKAGLLACNIFAVLPVPVRGQWTTRAKTLSLLTVAGQLVIYTQFPIIPGYYPWDLIRLMKEIRKNSFTGRN